MAKAFLLKLLTLLLLFVKSDISSFFIKSKFYLPLLPLLFSVNVLNLTGYYYYTEEAFFIPNAGYLF